LHLAAGTALQVRLAGSQIFDDLAQDPGARWAGFDQCFEIGDSVAIASSSGFALSVICTLSRF